MFCLGFHLISRAIWGRKRRLSISFEQTAALNSSTSPGDILGVFEFKNGEAPFGLTLDSVTINNKPTAVVLSALSVDENAQAGSVVAIASTTDPDGSDTFTYTLIPASDTFEMVGDQLRVKSGANLDYETVQSYDIGIKSWDPGGLTASGEFSIAVNEVAEPPTAINLTASAVDEGAVGGTVIADLSAVGGTPGYDFALTLDESGFFEIIGTQLLVKAGANIDYDTAQSHSITIEVTDQTPLTFSEVEMITVNEVVPGDGPTAINMIAFTVDDNAPAKMLAGVATATGGVTPYDFTLTPDASGFFEFSGNQLRVKAGANIDYTNATSHTVTVLVSDSNPSPETLSAQYTINVKPPVTNHAPTDIIISNIVDVPEGLPAGFVVATLAAVDPDAGDTHTFRINKIIRSFNSV